ncbi:hypothetical protein ACVVIH_12255 [Chryseobacterium arthrosphaerae]|uniref:hypothetical protein n=1 Tax=Chryseobacterium arthrosphaerae TaxID=651561 RepID=UPI003D356E05
MMNKKILVLLIICVNILKAQYPFQFSPPKTPAAYEIEKFGDPNVSLYTGRPNINIPLYTIKHGRIEIPLQISYHSNGIRADEEASKIGLGWFLETPLISQNIQGHDDLILSNKMPDYYYYYKSAYIVEPQPDYYVRTQGGTGKNWDRTNISTLMKANSIDHLNDYFMAKVRTDNGFLGGNLFYPFLPVNNQYEDFRIDDSGLYGKTFDIELDFFTANFFGTSLVFYKVPNQNRFFVLNKKGFRIEMNKLNTNNTNPLVDPLFEFIITAPSGIKYYFSQQMNMLATKPTIGNPAPDNYQSNEAIPVDYTMGSRHTKVPSYSLYTETPTPALEQLQSREWKISKIVDTNNNIVLYSYEPLPYVKRDNNNINGTCQFLYVLENRTDALNPSLSQTYNQTTQFYGNKTFFYPPGKQIKCFANYPFKNMFQDSFLKEIIFDNSKVVFNSSQRWDKAYDKKIDSIQIITNNQINHNIIFNYDYFPFNSVLSNRLMLNSVSVNKKRYSFDYYNKNFNSQNIDYWGFYNGLESTTPFINPFRFYQDISLIPGWATSLYEQSKGSENKSAHPENIKIGLLKKITYPTGGASKFDYELNTFDNYFVPNFDNKASVEKNKFNISHLNIDYDLNYTYTEAFNAIKDEVVKGEVKLSVYNYSYNIGNSYFKIVRIPDAWIDFYNSNAANKLTFWDKLDNNEIVTTTIFNKTNFANTSTTENYSIVIPMSGTYAAKVKYSKNAPTTGSPAGNISASLKHTMFSDYSQSGSQGFGVRIKKVIDYYKPGDSIIHKYSYFGGKHITPFKAVDDSNDYDYSSHFSDYQGTYLAHFMRRAVGYTFNTSTSSLLQSSLLGSDVNVGYDKVEVEDLDNNNVSRGKISYSFINIPDRLPSSKFGIMDGVTASTLNKFGIGIRDTEIDNGTIIKKEIIDANQKLKQSSVYNYLTSVFYLPERNYNVKLGYKGSTGHYSSYGWSEMSDYTLYYYPLKGRETLLENEVEISFFGNNQLETKVMQNYNTNNLLINRSIAYPDGSKNIESIKYATEKNNIKLINANMLNIPLEKQTMNALKTISLIETKYDNSGHLNPSSVLSYDIQNITNSPRIEFIYDKYDSKGNLEQYTTKDGISTVIIWGYNQTQPITKIEGAKLTDIQQAFIDSIVNASNTDASAGINNDETALFTAFKTFRDNLPNYQITTYTYDPLIGVRSITPPSGVRENYLYDSAGRLEKVIDMDGKILKEMKYNYKN